MNILKKLNACSEGAAFAEGYLTLQEAWGACPRGDWMLWLAKNLGVDLRTLTLAKGLCANTVRHLMKDPRSVAAVDAAIAFGRGEITKQELKEAYAAAAAASSSSSAAYAASAAYSAAAAADAAYAASSSSSAAYAVAYAAAAAARTKNRQQTADICREILTAAVFEKLAALEAAKGAKE